jgi:hypothetical protein
MGSQVISDQVSTSNFFLTILFLLFYLNDINIIVRVGAQKILF